MNCLLCGKEFSVNLYRQGKAKFCSRHCCDLFKVGKKQSKEHIQKRSETFKGHITSEETKKKISNSLKGQKHTSERTEKQRKSMMGRKFSEEHRRKMSKSQMGRISAMKGKRHSEETRRKMSIALKGRKLSDEHIRKISGENNWNWKGGLEFRKKDNSRIDSAYQEWRKQVRKRDNFECKINNQDCFGRIEVHHILSWRDYPELRYQINNGIALCHAHHPKKRAEEKKLIPYFIGLVPISSE